MSSEAQINANRQNASHSTGPRTPEGKAASSRNGFTHGLFTKHFVILPGENAEEFAALHENYDCEFLPATPAERHYVREITESQWRLARVGRWETNYLTGCGDNPDVNVLLKWDRLTNSARRAYRNAIRDINELRDKRGYTAISPDPRIEEPGIYRHLLPWPKPAAPEVCRTEPNSEPQTAPEPAPEAAPETAELKNCRTEPNSEPETAPEATPEPAPEAPEPENGRNEPPVIRVPYALAEELKELIRFQPASTPAAATK